MTFAPTSRARIAGKRNAGFALLVVLWALVLLALIVAHVTATGGTEARIAANLVEAARAEAAADGAVFETIFRLSDGSDKGWPVTGEHRLALPQGEALIHIDCENGKANPNTAPPELLAALFVAHGVEATRAARLASAIADWREPGDAPRPNGAKRQQYQEAGLDHAPPNDPLQSLDELGRVIGMTPALLAEITPDLSLHQFGLPDPKFASPAMRRALSALGQVETAGAGPTTLANVVTIIARVKLISGGQFVRRAVVRLGATDPNLYKILEWTQEAAR